MFEYGSFVQSKMFQRGVTCSDCHEPHGLKLAAEGDRLCTRCHQKTPPLDRFPALARLRKDFDDPAHRHHSEVSCVSCHLPERTYLSIDRRRDHSFRVPRPDLSVSIGVPNACTQSCHAGRGDRWAAEQVAKWFPGPKPEHFGEVFARSRRGEDAGAKLGALARDRELPPIVRATALDLLRAKPEACADARHDRSPLVRAAAIACGEALPPDRKLDWAGRALTDSSRLVRLEAATVLAGVPTGDLAAAATRARSELEARHRAELDLPDGSFHLALLAEADGRTGDAIELYRRALALDRQFLPAAFNLRALLRQLGSTR